MSLRGALLLLACLGPATAAAVPGPAAPVRHDVSMRLDPVGRDLYIVDRFSVQVENDLVFELVPWLEVVAAKVDGEPRIPQRAAGRIAIAANSSGEVHVELALQGRVPALPDAEQRSASTGAVSGMEGTFLPGYIGWLPRFGEAPVLFDLAIEVPTPYRVVATGRLAGEHLEEPVYRASFASDAPGEPPSVFAGEYVIDQRMLNGIRLRTYFQAELAPLAGDYLDQSADYIKAYSDIIGAYPYADFHVISAPLPVGLGFPNLTYVGRRILPLPFMRGRSLAHEIVHNWWGNGVGIDHASGNWAEGLTTYMADYALAVQQDDAAAERMRLGWLKNFTALPTQRDMPVEAFAGKSHDAGQVVGYDKVAFIFHMLKREMGDAAFNAGISGFWQKHRFRVGTWHDLQDAFEQASGTDLGWFFEQWLRRPGAPRIELAGAAASAGEAGYGISLSLLQPEPPFRLRVPVVIETTAGPHQVDVSLDKPMQEFHIPLRHEALAVKVDPRFETFRRLLPGENPPIFRDVTLSEQTVLVVASKSAAFAQTAYGLAGRLLERHPAVYELKRNEAPNTAMLIIGTTGEIDALRPRPDADIASRITSAGSARAWVEQQPNGHPIFVVSANDTAALQAVLRPLPHYRGQSYVVFEGSRAIDKGLWQSTDSPLSYRFTDN